MWRWASPTCSSTSRGSSDSAGGVGAAPAAVFDAAAAAAAAWRSAASGVLIACATSPACVRARVTTSALRSSTALKSSTSGCTCEGGDPCSLSARPSWTAPTARCNARSGARPTAICNQAAAPSSASSTASEAASTPLKRCVAACNSVRSAATATRQRAAASPSRRTVRCTASSGSPFGPASGCTRTEPSAIPPPVRPSAPSFAPPPAPSFAPPFAAAGSTSVASHKERERRMPAGSGAPTPSTCQYSPERGRLQCGSLSAPGRPRAGPRRRTRGAPSPGRAAPPARPPPGAARGRGRARRACGKLPELEKRLKEAQSKETGKKDAGKPQLLRTMVGAEEIAEVDPAAHREPGEQADPARALRAEGRDPGGGGEGRVRVFEDGALILTRPPARVRPARRVI